MLSQGWIVQGRILQGRIVLGRIVQGWIIPVPRIPPNAENTCMNVIKRTSSWEKLRKWSDTRKERLFTPVGQYEYLVLTHLVTCYMYEDDVFYVLLALIFFANIKLIYHSLTYPKCYVH
jgi:hypothetical protein